MIFFKRFKKSKFAYSKNFKVNSKHPIEINSSKKIVVYKALYLKYDIGFNCREIFV
jgi:hypothetical protein